MKLSRKGWVELAGFGQRVGEVDGMRVVAFDSLQLMTAREHAIEFVDEHGDGFVALVGFDGGVHVRAVDDHVALGLEPSGGRLIAVALQFHADAHDALLVSKQSLGFLADKRLEGRSQFEMDARDDQFVVVLAVHVSAYGLG